MPDFETPPALSPGDAVAVVAPSSGAAAAFPHVYELGLQRLREVFDLRPVEYPTVERDDDYLLDNPEERAREIEDAFRDPEVRGVVATIGGNDQLRILPHLDPEVLGENPTRFYGYSDATNLALYLWNLGVVSWQGPMVLTELAMQGEMHDYTVEHARRAFFEETMGEVRPAARFTDDALSWADPANLEKRREFEDNPGWRWQGTGQVTGRVWGGNLEILEMQLVANRWLPDPADLDGAVLFVETSEELRSADWVWESLVGMGERGLLERFDGVVVGRAVARTHREDRPPERRERYRQDQREAVLDAVERYNPDATVLLDFDSGHTHPIVPVPVGSRVTLDPGADLVRFEGP